MDGGKRSQQRFVAFAGDQIADTEDCFRNTDISRWGKYLGIHTIIKITVVLTGTAAPSSTWSRTLSLTQITLFAARYTNREIRLHQLPPYPLTWLVERVQTMHGDHKRNAQFTTEQDGRMSTGQSRVSVDDMHRIGTMNLTHSSQNAGEQKSSGTGKTKPARKRRKASPPCWKDSSVGMGPSAIERLHC